MDLPDSLGVCEVGLPVILSANLGSPEHAEVCSQATLNLNCQALGLLMESMENSQQAQKQAVCARQWFENLLSVASCHCECMHSRQHALETTC